MKTVPGISSQLYSWMRDIRKTIHQHPELSCEELTTAAFVHQKLSAIGIRSVRRVADTGLVAEIGSPDTSAIVGLRADMDALPIVEETGLSYASVNPGIMHSCGHDGMSPCCSVPLLFYRRWNFLAEYDSCFNRQKKRALVQKE